ncbi:unnamed protein product, partial [Rotaria magnacalcarata]
MEASPAIPRFSG